MPRPQNTRQSLEAALRLARLNNWQGREKELTEKLEQINREGN